MSVALNGSGNYTRATMLSAGQNFTACCWFMPTTLPGPSGYQSILGDDAQVSMQLHRIGSGNTLFSMSTGANDGDSATAMSTGVWYFGALSAVSSTTQTVYLNGVQAATRSDPAAHVAAMNIGCWTGSTDRFIGRVAFVKIWAGANLTLNEIMMEMWQGAPYRHANLRAFYPMWDLSADETDHSANAQTLTVAGSGHAVAEMPPIPFRLQRNRKSHIPYTVAAAGRTTKNTRSWPLGTEIGMGWRMECAGR